MLQKTPHVRMAGFLLTRHLFFLHARGFLLSRCASRGITLITLITPTARRKDDLYLGSTDQNVKTVQ